MNCVTRMRLMMQVVESYGTQLPVFFPSSIRSSSAWLHVGQVLGVALVVARGAVVAGHNLGKGVPVSK